MRRINFLNSRKLNLTGILYPANSDAIVIMAHGFLSDKTSSGRFDYIALCLNAAGYNILTFDFSGYGESDNDKITCAKQIDDLESAVAYVLSLGYKRLALWGHSLGSRICLQAYSSEIVTMILTGALLGPVYYKWEEHFSQEQLDELAKHGYITQIFERGPRRAMIIDKQMLDDFAEFDQQMYFSKIACPVLVINGDGDSEELVLKEVSKKAMHLLPTGSRHEILHGANHQFLRYLDEIVNLGLSWLQKQMPCK
jgi:pimeloyl-ACP methyl ester carboxylesterase